MVPVRTWPWPKACCVDITLLFILFHNVYITMFSTHCTCDNIFSNVTLRENAKSSSVLQWYLSLFKWSEIITKQCNTYLSMSLILLFVDYDFIISKKYIFQLEGILLYGNWIITVSLKYPKVFYLRISAINWNPSSVDMHFLCPGSYLYRVRTLSYYSHLLGSGSL